MSQEHAVEQRLESVENTLKTVAKHVAKLSKVNFSKMDSILETLDELNGKTVVAPSPKVKKNVSDMNQYKVSIKPHKKLTKNNLKDAKTEHHYENVDTKFIWTFLFVPGVKFLEHMRKLDCTEEVVTRELDLLQIAILDIINSGVYRWKLGAKPFMEILDLMAKDNLRAKKQLLNMKEKVADAFKKLIDQVFLAINVAQGTSLTQSSITQYKKEFNKFFVYKEKDKNYNLQLNANGNRLNFYNEFVKICQPIGTIPFPYNIKKSTDNGIEINKTLYWYLVGVNAPEGSMVEKFFRTEKLPETLTDHHIRPCKYLEETEYTKYIKACPKGNQSFIQIEEDNQIFNILMVGSDSDSDSDSEHVSSDVNDAASDMMIEEEKDEEEEAIAFESDD